jgi:hypothetical protein
MGLIPKVLKRFGISLVIGFLFGIILNEVAFQFVKETNRAPKTVRLIIPEGTAAEVSNGGDVLELPKEMTFVVGDVLLVENQDLVDHQLGPLWIPAGTEASLSLDEEENFIFTCTFNATNFFGLDVREPVTAWTRISGTIFAGLPMAAILTMYSFVIWPIKNSDEVDESAA